MDRNRVFGGDPLAVVLRLIVLSVVAGIVLSALDIRPENLIYHVRMLFRRIYDMGFGAIESIIAYFLLGAVVVVPIWLIVRLLAVMRRRDGR